MATSELVRIKVEDQAGNGLEDALVRIFDTDNILKAQGLTSKGPVPDIGIFETILDGTVSPGTLYTIDVARFAVTFAGRSQIRVRTGG